MFRVGELGIASARLQVYGAPDDAEGVRVLRQPEALEVSRACEHRELLYQLQEHRTEALSLRAGAAVVQHVSARRRRRRRRPTAPRQGLCSFRERVNITRRGPLVSPSQTASNTGSRRTSRGRRSRAALPIAPHRSSVAPGWRRSCSASRLAHGAARKRCRGRTCCETRRAALGPSGRCPQRVRNQADSRARRRRSLHHGVHQLTQSAQTHR